MIYDKKWNIRYIYFTQIVKKNLKFNKKEPYLLGLSTKTHTRTTRGKLFDPYLKWTNQTPVMVSSGSQPPESETGRLVGESTLQNLIPTDPTTFILETLTNFRKYEEFLIISQQIRWDPTRSHWDLDRSIEIQRDLFEI